MGCGGGGAKAACIVASSPLVDQHALNKNGYGMLWLRLWVLVLVLVLLLLLLLLLCVVVVVVEWLYYFKRMIIVRWADLSDFFVRSFSSVKCVFLFHVQ